MGVGPGGPGPRAVLPRVPVHAPRVDDGQLGHRPAHLPAREHGLHLAAHCVHVHAVRLLPLVGPLTGVDVPVGIEHGSIPKLCVVDKALKGAAKVSTSSKVDASAILCRK